MRQVGYFVSALLFAAGIYVLRWAISDGTVQFLGPRTEAPANWVGMAWFMGVMLMSPLAIVALVHLSGIRRQKKQAADSEVAAAVQPAAGLTPNERQHIAQARQLRRDRFGS